MRESDTPTYVSICNSCENSSSDSTAEMVLPYLDITVRGWTWLKGCLFVVKVAISKVPYAAQITCCHIHSCSAKETPWPWKLPIFLSTNLVALRVNLVSTATLMNTWAGSYCKVPDYMPYARLLVLAWTWTKTSLPLWRWAGAQVLPKATENNMAPPCGVQTSQAR